VYNTNTLSEAAVMWFLGLVELGIIKLATPTVPRDEYFGTPVYAASNGWTLCVFCDAGDWDYLEWVRDEDGLAWDFEGVHDADRLGDGLCTPVQNYRPSDEVCDGAYRWRG
jgi:hypothetical protein